MPTANPSKNVHLPTPHESSAMRPSRDSDDPRQAWKRISKQKEKILSDGISLEMILRKIEALRRQIRGGSGTGGTGGFAEEYDETKKYTQGQIVKITTARMVGAITLVPGVYAVNIAETDRNGLVWGGDVTYSSGDTNTVPQYPLPSSGTLYWNWLIVYCGGI